LLLLSSCHEAPLVLDLSDTLHVGGVELRVVRVVERHAAADRCHYHVLELSWGGIRPR